MTPVAIYLDCLFGNSHQIDIIPTLGTIFAASYFGLYARFASQWSYLANLYNQIKATETVIADGDTKGLRVIAEWKAGFMEDAQDLHLATKKNVVSTILIWGSDKAVSKAFADHTPGGKERFNALIKDVKAAYDLHEKALVKKIGSGTTAAS
ncbi:MAG: hypothetical protein HY308_04890 [Gammaproteobacteria bacterium]|nr:hypothetical protein [Gammaproteobacteria bacterium]